MKLRCLLLISLLGLRCIAAPPHTKTGRQRTQGASETERYDQMYQESRAARDYSPPMGFYGCSDPIDVCRKKAAEYYTRAGCAVETVACKIRESEKHQNLKGLFESHKEQKTLIDCQVRTTNCQPYRHPNSDGCGCQEGYSKSEQNAEKPDRSPLVCKKRD
jgi:hypothetical protein